MEKQSHEPDTSLVDKSLVAMFLKLTPEERLRANDNAVRAILEMRESYRKTQENEG
ncbi:MAG: hypothetical protein ACLFRG_15965 [Desulfococcaceae bacterium]|jgi:hypothetical protein